MAIVRRPGQQRTSRGEAHKRQMAKEVLVITDENEIPVTSGSKVTAYLTRGMAEAAAKSQQKNFPNATLQVTEFVPKSSKLIFMDVLDDDE